MNPHYRPQQSPAVTIGVMLLGIAVCVAWISASAPAAVPLLTERITGGHLVLLVVLLVVGLISTSIFARAAEVGAQLLFLFSKIGLLVLVVIAGVFVWRWSSGQNLQRLTTAPPTESFRQPPPVPVAVEDPEDRRRALEAQLLQLDRDQGKSWWSK